MMRTLVVYSLLFFHVPVSGVAQQEAAIVGKWFFQNIRRADEQNSLSTEASELVYGKGAYRHFFEDHTFVQYTNDQYSYGKWELTGDRRIILITYHCTLELYNGAINQFELSKITKDTLIFYLPGKNYMTLIRGKDNGDSRRLTQFQKHVPTVTATKEQISRRWKLKETKSPTGTQQASDSSNRPWFDFRSDGTYTRKSVGIRKGVWTLEDDHTSVALIDENNTGQLWYILSISSGQLTIQRPGSDAQLIFEIDTSPR